MKNMIVQDRRIRIGMQALFIYTWIVNLSKTDSFLTVYLLCGLLGVLCLWDNEISKNAPAGRAGACVLAGLFAIATVMANYPLFEPVTALISLFNGGCAIVGGYFTAYHILIWGIRRLPLKTEGERKHGVLAFFLFAGAIVGVFLLFLYTTGYPVYLAHDSIVSLNQIKAGVYTNHHPYWYTRFIKLCMDLGYLFSTDINVAASVYSAIQCCIMGACFGYCLVTLYQAPMPMWTILVTFCVYAFAPYHLTYSITMWKDTLFGGCTLAMLTALYRIIRRIGKCRWLNYGVFVLASIGFCLVRNNGLPVFLGWAVILLLFLGRENRKVLIFCLLVLLIAGFMTGPLLAMLDVGSTEMVEVLAIPFQQIARVVAYDLPIGEEDRAILEQIFDLNMVKDLYTPYIVDPIKFDAILPGGQAYILEDMGRFFSLWLRLGRQYPGEYVRAWVEQTKGYWNGGYYYWIYIRYTYPDISGIGGFKLNNPGKTVFDAIFRYLEKPAILEPLYAIGLHVWIIIGCCYICAVQKRREWLLAVPMVVLAVGLWVITPVYAEFRYAYPMFTSCPLLLLTMVFSAADEDRKQVRS